MYTMLYVYTCMYYMYLVLAARMSDSVPGSVTEG